MNRRGSNIRGTLCFPLILLVLLLSGCATTIQLDQRASDEMTAYFKRQASGHSIRIICSPRLAQYVYQGYPSGLTGSEVKATINIGETICKLIDQAGAIASETAGDQMILDLDLKNIKFTYSYRGTALWAEEGRDFDAVFILIKLEVASGSQTREYTLITEKEHYESSTLDRSVKYAIVNSALEDIIFQLFGKVYQDFIP